MNNFEILLEKFNQLLSKITYLDKNVWEDLIRNANTPRAFINLTNIVKDLTEAYDAVVDTINVINDILSNHEDRIVDLEAFRVEAEAKIAAIENNINTINTRLNEITATLTTHANQIGEINGKVDAIDDRIDAIDASIIEINNDIDDLIAKVATNTADIAWLKEQTQSSVRISQVLEITGNTNELNTENKTNLVAAVNEVNNKVGDLDDKIGDLDDLVTQDKSNLVAAINEAYNHGGSGGASDAVDVSYDNTDSGMTADNVQSAIDELHMDIFGGAQGPVYDHFDYDLAYDIMATSITDLFTVMSTPFNGMKALVANNVGVDLVPYTYNGSTSQWEANGENLIGKTILVKYNYNVPGYGVSIEDKLNVKLEVIGGHPTSPVEYEANGSLYTDDDNNLGWYKGYSPNYPGVGEYGFSGETMSQFFPFRGYQGIQYIQTAYIPYIGDKLAVGKYFYVEQYWDDTNFRIVNHDAKVTITGVGESSIGKYISGVTIEEVNDVSEGIVKVDGTTIVKDANGVLSLAPAILTRISNLETSVANLTSQLANLTIASVEASDADASSASLANTNAVFGVEETNV